MVVFLVVMWFIIVRVPNLYFGTIQLGNLTRQVWVCSVATRFRLSRKIKVETCVEGRDPRGQVETQAET